MHHLLNIHPNRGKIQTFKFVRQGIFGNPHHFFIFVSPTSSVGGLCMLTFSLIVELLSVLCLPMVWCAKIYIMMIIYWLYYISSLYDMSSRPAYTNPKHSII